MRARTARRMAERVWATARRCGTAPSEWAQMTRSQRKKAKSRAKRRRLGGEAADA